MDPSSTFSSESPSGPGLKPFLRDLGVFALLQSALLGLLLAFFYDPVARFPTESATRIKHERLEAAASPRAIFVGGSNLLFGLRSEWVEQRTGYHPVNLGLIGGLRLRYVLNEAQASVREGDLVVLAIEYQQLFADPEAAKLQVLARVVERRPANARFLSWGHWRLMLDRGIIEYSGSLLRAILDGVRGRRGRRRVFEAVNEYGDLTLYRDGAPPAREKQLQTLPRKLPPGTLEESIEMLNRFHETCRRRGAEVVASHPPVARSQYEHHEEMIARFDEILRTECTIPMITTRESMVIPDEYSIDGRYHFWGRGIDLRTERLVQAMNRHAAGSTDAR